MSATRLFDFRFRARLDPDRANRLRRETGMTISFGDFGNSPGRGVIAPGVWMYMEEEREYFTNAEEPDVWIIEASTHDPDTYDRDAVERMRGTLRTVLGEIAEWWEERDPAKHPGPSTGG